MEEWRESRESRESRELRELRELRESRMELEYELTDTCPSPWESRERKARRTIAAREAGRGEVTARRNSSMSRFPSPFLSK